MKKIVNSILLIGLAVVVFVELYKNSNESDSFVKDSRPATVVDARPPRNSANDDISSELVQQERYRTQLGLELGVQKFDLTHDKLAMTFYPEFHQCSAGDVDLLLMDQKRQNDSKVKISLESLLSGKRVETVVQSSELIRRKSLQVSLEDFDSNDMLSLYICNIRGDIPCSEGKPIDAKKTYMDFLKDKSARQTSPTVYYFQLFQRSNGILELFDPQMLKKTKPQSLQKFTSLTSSSKAGLQLSPQILRNILKFAHYIDSLPVIASDRQIMLPLPLNAKFCAFAGSERLRREFQQEFQLAQTSAKAP